MGEKSSAFCEKILLGLKVLCYGLAITVLVSCETEETPAPDPKSTKPKTERPNKKEKTPEPLQISRKNTITVEKIADQTKQVGGKIVLSAYGVDELGEKIKPIITKSNDSFDAKITEDGTLQITFLKAGEGDLTLSYTSEQKIKTEDTNNDEVDDIITYEPQTKTLVIHITTKEAPEKPPEPLKISRKNTITLNEKIPAQKGKREETVFVPLPNVTDALGQKLVPNVNVFQEHFEATIENQQLKIKFLGVGKGVLYLDYNTTATTKQEDTNADGVLDTIMYQPQTEQITVSVESQAKNIWDAALLRGEIQKSYIRFGTPRGNLNFPGLKGYDEKSIREYFKTQPKFFPTNTRELQASYLGSKVTGLEYDCLPNGLGDKEILLYVVAQSGQKAPVYRKDLIRVLSGMKDFAKRGMSLVLIDNTMTNEGFKNGGEPKELGNIMTNNRMEWTMVLFGRNLAKIKTDTVNIDQLVDAMIPAMQDGFSADLSDEQIHLNLKQLFEDLGSPGRSKPVDANW